MGRNETNEIAFRAISGNLSMEAGKRVNKDTYINEMFFLNLDQLECIEISKERNIPMEEIMNVMEENRRLLQYFINI